MLRLLVALEPEARPLAARLGLARDPRPRPFPLWGDPAGDVVVASGPGKASVAAAVGWLAGLAGDGPAIWLDAGTAGHGTRPPGTVLLAHKVVDAASGRAAYPPLVFAPPVETAEVITVDGVERTFARDAAYEQEASAFVAAARRFSTAELVQVVKVISDGLREPAERLTPVRVEALVAAAADTVAAVIDALREPAAAEARRLADPPELATLVDGRRFTVSERRRLRALLVRRRALAAGRPLPPAVVAARRGSELVRALAGWLDGLPSGLAP